MTWLIFATGFELFCLLLSAAFVLWCFWSLFWHLYDTHQENTRRISNETLNAHRVTTKFTVGSDAK